MADTQVNDSKSTEVPKAPKEFTVTLPSLDGSVQVVAHLQENAEDATHPPRLIKLAKNPLEPPHSATTLRETHIILSAGSGHKQAASFCNDVVYPILDLIQPGFIDDAEEHITEDENSILEFTRDIFFPAANKGVPLRIIVASGDGGIVDLVNGFLEQPHSDVYIAPEVVLLPLGTANALYHSINPGQNQNTWGLSALAPTTSKPLPTFTATFSPESRLLVAEATVTQPLPHNGKGEGMLHGAVVFSWGMHASLVADSDSAEYRKFGIDRFKMAAQEALYPSDGSLPHAYRARVSVLGKDGEWKKIESDEHLYTLATAVSNLEAPFCISPASKPLDGSVHLVYFGPTTGDEAMRIMGLAYQGGKHVNDDMVRYEAIEGLRIEFDEEDDRWRRVCVDGKIVRVDKGGWVELRKGSRSGGVNIVVAE
jgi:diacylglycerol kinase family enzyme